MRAGPTLAAVRPLAFPVQKERKREVRQLFDVLFELWQLGIRLVRAQKMASTQTPPLPTPPPHTYHVIRGITQATGSSFCAPPSSLSPPVAHSSSSFPLPSSSSASPQSSSLSFPSSRPVSHSHSSTSLPSSSLCVVCVADGNGDASTRATAAEPCAACTAGSETASASGSLSNVSVLVTSKEAASESFPFAEQLSENTATAGGVTLAALAAPALAPAARIGDVKGTEAPAAKQKPHTPVITRRGSSSCIVTLDYIGSSDNFRLPVADADAAGVAVAPAAETTIDAAANAGVACVGDVGTTTLTTTTTTSTTTNSNTVTTTTTLCTTTTITASTASTATATTATDFVPHAGDFFEDKYDGKSMDVLDSKEENYDGCCAKSCKCIEVVALLSGGKDSIFCMHSVAALGPFRVVAAATLLPPPDTIESDSYMFQSACTQLMHHVAAATGLPLFTREIKGASLETSELFYEETQGDEVEDLFFLIQDVKRKFPCLRAVASGALFSDYQRLRLENVCARLGLVPLNLLWQLPQPQLLSAMISWGMHAVLVKVAAMGLGAADVGKTIKQQQQHFRALDKSFGFHQCGEGGEYETFVLDCPLYFFFYISLEKWDLYTHSEDDVAPVLLLQPRRCRLIPKVLPAVYIHPNGGSVQKSEGATFSKKICGSSALVTTDICPNESCNKHSPYMSHRASCFRDPVNISSDTRVHQRSSKSSPETNNSSSTGISSSTSSKGTISSNNRATTTSSNNTDTTSSSNSDGGSSNGSKRDASNGRNRESNNSSERHNSDSSNTENSNSSRGVWQSTTGRRAAEMSFHAFRERRPWEGYIGNVAPPCCYSSVAPISAACKFLESVRSLSFYFSAEVQQILASAAAQYKESLLLSCVGGRALCGSSNDDCKKCSIPSVRKQMSVLSPFFVVHDRMKDSKISRRCNVGVDAKEVPVTAGPAQEAAHSVYATATPTERRICISSTPEEAEASETWSYRDQSDCISCTTAEEAADSVCATASSREQRNHVLRRAGRPQIIFASPRVWLRARRFGNKIFINLGFLPLCHSGPQGTCSSCTEEDTDLNEYFLEFHSNCKADTLIYRLQSALISSIKKLVFFASAEVSEMRSPETMWKCAIGHVLILYSREDASDDVYYSNGDSSLCKDTSSAFTSGIDLPQQDSFRSLNSKYRKTVCTNSGDSYNCDNSHCITSKGCKKYTRRRSGSNEDPDSQKRFYCRGIAAGSKCWSESSSNGGNVSLCKSCSSWAINTITTETIPAGVKRDATEERCLYDKPFMHCNKPPSGRLIAAAAMGALSSITKQPFAVVSLSVPFCNKPSYSLRMLIEVLDAGPSISLQPQLHNHVDLSCNGNSQVPFSLHSPRPPIQQKKGLLPKDNTNHAPAAVPLTASLNLVSLSSVDSEETVASHRNGSNISCGSSSSTSSSSSSSRGSGPLGSTSSSSRRGSGPLGNKSSSSGSSKSKSDSSTINSSGSTRSSSATGEDGAQPRKPVPVIPVTITTTTTNSVSSENNSTALPSPATSIVGETRHEVSRECAAGLENVPVPSSSRCSSGTWQVSAFRYVSEQCLMTRGLNLWVPPLHVLPNVVHYASDCMHGCHRPSLSCAVADSIFSRAARVTQEKRVSVSVPTTEKATNLPCLVDAPATGNATESSEWSCYSLIKREENVHHSCTTDEEDAHGMQPKQTKMIMVKLVSSSKDAKLQEKATTGSGISSNNTEEKCVDSEVSQHRTGYNGGNCASNNYNSWLDDAREVWIDDMSHFFKCCQAVRCRRQRVRYISAQQRMQSQMSRPRPKNNSSSSSSAVAYRSSDKNTTSPDGRDSGCPSKNQRTSTLSSGCSSGKKSSSSTGVSSRTSSGDGSCSSTTSGISDNSHSSSSCASNSSSSSTSSGTGTSRGGNSSNSTGNGSSSSSDSNSSIYSNTSSSSSSRIQCLNTKRLRWRKSRESRSDSPMNYKASCCASDSVCILCSRSTKCGDRWSSFDGPCVKVAHGRSIEKRGCHSSRGRSLYKCGCHFSRSVEKCGYYLTHDRSSEKREYQVTCRRSMEKRRYQLAGGRSSEMCGFHVASGLSTEMCRFFDLSSDHSSGKRAYSFTSTRSVEKRGYNISRFISRSAGPVHRSTLATGNADGEGWCESFIRSGQEAVTAAAPESLVEDERICCCCSRHLPFVVKNEAEVTAENEISQLFIGGVCGRVPHSDQYPDTMSATGHVLGATAEIEGTAAVVPTMDTHRTNSIEVVSHSESLCNVGDTARLRTRLMTTTSNTSRALPTAAAGASTPCADTYLTTTILELSKSLALEVAMAARNLQQTIRLCGGECRTIAVPRTRSTTTSIPDGNAATARDASDGDTEEANDIVAEEDNIFVAGIAGPNDTEKIVDLNVFPLPFPPPLLFVFLSLDTVKLLAHADHDRGKAAGKERRVRSTHGASTITEEIHPSESVEHTAYPEADMDQRRTSLVAHALLQPLKLQLQTHLLFGPVYDENEGSSSCHDNTVELNCVGKDHSRERLTTRARPGPSAVRKKSFAEYITQSKNTRPVYHVSNILSKQDNVEEHEYVSSTSSRRHCDNSCKPPLSEMLIISAVVDGSLQGGGRVLLWPLGVRGPSPYNGCAAPTRVSYNTRGRASRFAPFGAAAYTNKCAEAGENLRTVVGNILGEPSQRQRVGAVQNTSLPSDLLNDKLGEAVGPEAPQKEPTTRQRARESCGVCSAHRKRVLGYRTVVSDFGDVYEHEIFCRWNKLGRMLFVGDYLVSLNVVMRELLNNVKDPLPPGHRALVIVEGCGNMSDWTGRQTQRHTGSFPYKAIGECKGMRSRCHRSSRDSVDHLVENHSSATAVSAEAKSGCPGTLLNTGALEKSRCGCNSSVAVGATGGNKKDVSVPSTRAVGEKQGGDSPSQTMTEVEKLFEGKEQHIPCKDGSAKHVLAVPCEATWHIRIQSVATLRGRAAANGLGEPAEENCEPQAVDGAACVCVCGGSVEGEFWDYLSTKQRARGGGHARENTCYRCVMTSQRLHHHHSVGSNCEADWEAAVVSLMYSSKQVRLEWEKDDTSASGSQNRENGEIARQNEDETKCQKGDAGWDRAREGEKPPPLKGRSILVSMPAVNGGSRCEEDRFVTEEKAACSETENVMRMSVVHSEQDTGEQELGGGCVKDEEKTVFRGRGPRGTINRKCPYKNTQRCSCCLSTTQDKSKVSAELCLIAVIERVAETIVRIAAGPHSAASRVCKSKVSSSTEKAAIGDKGTSASRQVQDCEKQVELAKRPCEDALFLQATSPSHQEVYQRILNEIVIYVLYERPTVEELFACGGEYVGTRAQTAKSGIFYACACRGDTCSNTAILNVEYEVAQDKVDVWCLVCGQVCTGRTHPKEECRTTAERPLRKLGKETAGAQLRLDGLNQSLHGERERVVEKSQTRANLYERSAPPVISEGIYQIAGIPAVSNSRHSKKPCCDGGTLKHSQAAGNFFPIEDMGGWSWESRFRQNLVTALQQRLPSPVGEVRRIQFDGARGAVHNDSVTAACPCASEENSACMSGAARSFAFQRSNEPPSDAKRSRKCPVCYDFDLPIFFIPVSALENETILQVVVEAR